MPLTVEDHAFVTRLSDQEINDLIVVLQNPNLPGLTRRQAAALFCLSDLKHSNTQVTAFSVNHFVADGDGFHARREGTTISLTFNPMHFQPFADSLKHILAGREESQRVVETHASG